MPLGRSLGKLGYDLCQHDVASGAGGPVSLGKCNMWDWNDEGGGANDYKENETKMSDFIFNDLMWNDYASSSNGVSTLQRVQSDALWLSNSAAHHIDRAGEATGSSYGSYLMYNANAVHSLPGFGDGFINGMLYDAGGNADGIGGAFFGMLGVDANGTALNIDKAISTIGDWSENDGDMDGKFLAPFYAIGTDNPHYKEVFIYLTGGGVWEDWDDEEPNMMYDEPDQFPFCWGIGVTKSPLLRNWNFNAARAIAPNASGGGVGPYSPRFTVMAETLGDGNGQTFENNPYIGVPHITYDPYNDIGTLCFAQILYFEATNDDLDLSGNHGGVYGGFYKGLYNQYNQNTGVENTGWNGSHCVNGTDFVEGKYQMFGVIEEQGSSYPDWEKTNNAYPWSVNSA